MSAPAWLLVVRWLTWDTFRQALASRIFWLMLGVSALSVVFCLSVSTTNLPTKEEAPELVTAEELAKLPESYKGEVAVVRDGRVNFLFGAVSAPYAKHREDAVRWLQLHLAEYVADRLGLLLALIRTAAFLPTFLEPSAVAVLLAKPVPRWSILLGKFVGVMVLVTAQASAFVFGTWLALAIRTGVWDPHYLWCVPVLVIHFAVFFSFSCMLAVWTRSTIVCVLGSLLFWCVCWGMNYGRHAALAESLGQRETASAEVGRGTSLALEAGYWVLPKPADVGIVLSKLLDAGDYVAQSREFSAVEKHGALHLEMSLLASCLFALAMLAVAGYEFVKAEY